mgnify:CR=1 FL=1
MQYNPSFPFKNSYVSSIYPTLFRRPVLTVTKRLNFVTTRDGDVINFDWYRDGNDKVAVISHGLGGNNTRPYILGMTKALLAKGWDVIAWNCRSSGEIMNRTPAMYHGGSIDDLEDLIDCIEEKDVYKNMALVGFSLGANINLLYLGKKGGKVSKLISKSAAFSVPCDLKGCALELEKPKNRVFMNHFLRTFKKLIARKEKLFPGEISLDGFNNITNFREYDNRYTAPLHGFVDAEDYWMQCSCKKYLEDITVDVLLISAINDPFLSDACYPIEESKNNINIRLITPKHGGHVGFVSQRDDSTYWSEKIAGDYLSR